MGLELSSTAPENMIHEENRITLTAHQIADILRFPGFVPVNKRRETVMRFTPFGALRNIISDNSASRLEDLAKKIECRNKEIRLYKGNGNGSFFDGLIPTIQDYDPDAAEILGKISEIANLYLVTADDLATEGNFRKLPLVVQLCFAQSGPNVFRQIKNFLKTGGIVTILQFKKPSPDYLDAIDQIPGNDGLSVSEKISLAFAEPTEEIKHASHEFTVVNLIPQEQTEPKPFKKGNHDHLRYILNSAIDNGFEKDFAKLILNKEILTEEMEAVQYSMLGIILAVPTIYALKLLTNNSPTIDAVSQLFFPIVADIVSFFAKLRPWLNPDRLDDDFNLNIRYKYEQLKKLTEGNSFTKRKTLIELLLLTKARAFFQAHETIAELYDMGQKLARPHSSHNQSFVSSLFGQSIGTVGAQLINQNSNYEAGAWLYSVIPFIVSLLTSRDTFEHLKKVNKGKPDEEILNMLLSNPAELPVNIGAFLMFILGGLIFGELHQFDNPIFLATIEGMGEHATAAALIKLGIEWGPSREFNSFARYQIKRWLDSTGRTILNDHN